MKEIQEKSSFTPAALRGVADYVGIGLLCLGAFGFFFQLACGVGIWSIPERLAWPLTEVGCIAVDANGQVYCGLVGMGRVQQYSPNGDFIRGWQVDASGGLFYMQVVADRLYVRTTRTHRLYEFDLNGRQPSTRPSDDRMSGFPDQPVAYADGSTYWVSNGLSPRLMKRDPYGRTTVLVASPAYLWPISGPGQAWLTAVVGMIILGVTTQLRAWRARQ